MGERVAIVIEYDVDPPYEKVLPYALTQIRDGVAKLDKNHIRTVQIHVAIHEDADRVLAIFDPNEDKNELIDPIKKVLEEDYHAALLLDQGHVLMAAKADGMRLVIRRVREVLNQQTKE